MIEDGALASLLKDMESDRVERKASLADPDKIRQAICAFANDLPDHGKPGVLFVGLNDDGTCAGQAITESTLITLSNMRSDGNILPFPMLTVQKRVLGGCELAVVVVEPSDAPPVRYRGRVWIRVGPRRAVASPQEERRLSEKRRAADLPFDLRPVPAATMTDLDLALVERIYLPSAIAPDILEANERSLTQQLSALRLATAQTPPDPTVLGVLVAAQDPRRFLPGAYLQFLRVEGDGLTDPIRHQREISGPLPDLMRDLDAVLEPTSPSRPMSQRARLSPDPRIIRSLLFSNSPATR